MEKDNLERIAADLDAIKKMLALSLIQKGLKQGSVAAAIGISDATLSKMFPKGLLKEAKRRVADE